MILTNKRRVPIGLLLLAVLVAVGAGVGIVRMINGLGSTTSLSDGYPWGLWIVYDVFFVPFSAGAFMILAVTHIYNRREYHSIARPVVLAGFLGEVMVIAVLVMDLGRWHQFYNVLIPWYWNIHSFMFQVSICLTIYMGIMLLEVAPAVLERLNWQKPLRLIGMLTVLICWRRDRAVVAAPVLAGLIVPAHALQTPSPVVDAAAAAIFLHLGRFCRAVHGHLCGIDLQADLSVRSGPELAQQPGPGRVGAAGFLPGTQGSRPDPCWRDGDWYFRKDGSAPVPGRNVHRRDPADGAFQPGARSGKAAQV